MASFLGQLTRCLTSVTVLPVFFSHIWTNYFSERNEGTLLAKWLTVRYKVLIISICVELCQHITYTHFLSHPFQSPRALSGYVSTTHLFVRYNLILLICLIIFFICPINLKIVIFKAKVTWKDLILSSLPQLFGMFYHGVKCLEFGKHI